MSELRVYYRPAAGAVEQIAYTPDGSRLCTVRRLTPTEAWALMIQLQAAVADPMVGLIPRDDDANRSD